MIKRSVKLLEHLKDALYSTKRSLQKDLCLPNSFFTRTKCIKCNYDIIQLPYCLINCNIIIFNKSYANSVLSARIKVSSTFPNNYLVAIMRVQTDGKIMVVDRSSRQFRLQEVWWLHSCLTNATEMINSVYAVQLLLWISSMSFNTLTRIYTINDGGAISLPLLIVREVMLVSACVTNLLIISIVCHATAYQVCRFMFG